MSSPCGEFSCLIPFRRIGKQVEGGVVIGPEEVVWVTALRTNDIGTLNGITTEEDGLNRSAFLWFFDYEAGLTYPVETNDIIVTLASVELDGKTTRITSGVWKFTTDCNGGESEEERSLAADAREKVGLVNALDPRLVSQS